MNSGIVKFTNDAGQAIEITPRDVTELICPGATQKEVALFLAHCKAHKLDPFTKEAYLIKYGDRPASIVTNYNVFNARAQRFADYLGIEDGVVILDKQGNIERRPGSAVYTKALGEKLLGGWARVMRRDKEDTYVELALEDYSTGQAKWKTSPGLMINKCAKSAAWRTAFPSEFNGMYSAEEMEQAQGPVEVEPVTVKPVAVEPEAADLDGVRSRFKAFMAATGLNKEAATGALCAKAGVSDMHAMDQKQADMVAAWMDEKVAEAEQADILDEEEF